MMIEEDDNVAVVVVALLWRWHCAVLIQRGASVELFSGTFTVICGMIYVLSTNCSTNCPLGQIPAIYISNLSLTTCTCWSMDSTVVSNVILKANNSNIWYLIKLNYLKLNHFSCALWGSVFSHARHGNNNLMPSSQWHETALDFSTHSLNKHDKTIKKKKSK